MCVFFLIWKWGGQHVIGHKFLRKKSIFNYFFIQNTIYTLINPYIASNYPKRSISLKSTWNIKTLWVDIYHFRWWEGQITSRWDFLHRIKLIDTKIVPNQCQPDSFSLSLGSGNFLSALSNQGLKSKKNKVLHDNWNFEILKYWATEKLWSKK